MNRTLQCKFNNAFLVCVLPLNKDVDTNGVMSFLTQCDEEAIINKSPSGCTHIR